LRNGAHCLLGNRELLSPLVLLLLLQQTAFELLERAYVLGDLELEAMLLLLLTLAERFQKPVVNFQGLGLFFGHYLPEPSRPLAGAGHLGRGSVLVAAPDSFRAQNRRLEGGLVG
jgi:hypothetical protein